MEIITATPDFAEKLLEIYTPYVNNTAVSFEYVPPSVEEFRKRIENTLKEYPYLVAFDNGEIVGYAYAASFHTREAYKHCAELSIYIKKDYHGKGIGRKLYERIEEILLLQNVFSVHACIASPDREDEHLTSDSEKFHEKMGFTVSGRHDKCGYKFGKWYSIVWMDKSIADRPVPAEPFIPYSEIKNRGL